jgi:hypothetical protein
MNCKQINNKQTKQKKTKNTTTTTTNNKNSLREAETLTERIWDGGYTIIKQ